jgi:Ca2+/Na+ antiporter
METDELKAGWSVLSERLEKNEILNKRIIKEMISKRTRSAYNRLLGYNVFGLVILFGVILWVFLFAVIQYKGFPLPILIASEAGLIISVIWQTVKVRILNRFQLLNTGAVIDLSLWAAKYKLLIRREFIVTFVGGSLFLLLLFFLFHNFTLWAILFVVVLAIFVFILDYIIYIHVEKRNILTIEQTIAELKELEKED